jgi:hypothetical protein
LEIPPKRTHQRFYIANGTYNMSTMLIKLSLLFQYLRIFDAGATRTVCIGMIILTSIWGIAFSVMAWFPCFPIRAYWEWSLTGATCYAYGMVSVSFINTTENVDGATGTKERGPFVTTYESHSALNLILDLCVFLTPISIIWRKQRSKRENIAILGLFALGAL